MSGTHLVFTPSEVKHVRMKCHIKKCPDIETVKTDILCEHLPSLECVNGCYRVCHKPLFYKQESFDRVPANMRLLAEVFLMLGQHWTHASLDNTVEQLHQAGLNQQDMHR